MASRLNRIICILLNIIIVMAAAGILGLSLYSIRKEGVLGSNGALDDISVSEAILPTNAEPSNVSSAASQPESFPTNSDPDYYRQLANEAMVAGDLEGAVRILEEGITNTSSEELILHLEEVQLTQELPERQRTLLNDLCYALSSGEREQIHAALATWVVAEHNSSVLASEAPWLSLDDKTFAWDGSQFRRFYTGIGMAFDENGIYYGNLTEGVPDGTGTCIWVDGYYLTWNAVSYLQLDGTWAKGVVVGDGRYLYQNTSAACDPNKVEVTCMFDGTEEETIISAEFRYSLMMLQETHQYLLTVQDGRLIQDGFFYDSATGRTACSCIIHAGCGAGMDVTPFLELIYRNPYPWGKENVYPEPATIPMYNLSQNY